MNITTNNNPFALLQEELEAELAYRKARNDYYIYCQRTIFGFKKTRFHEYLCKKVQEFIETETGNAYDILLLSVPPQHGKQQAFSDDILTLDGWKKFGDVHKGDYVFAPNGKPIIVLDEIHQTEPSTLLVTTSSGDQLKVHPNHEWVVYNRHKHGKVLETVETKYMLSKGVDNKIVGRGHRYYFQLPEKAPLDPPRKQLYVDPYIMGVWLGDGKTSGPVICAHPKDIITLNEARETYPEGHYSIHKTTGVIYYYYKGLMHDLHKYNLCRKGVIKHIPEDYLTASLDQRLELLAGLIDTDGYLDKEQCRYTFTTSDEALKDTFKTLIATFGWHCSEHEVLPTISSSGIKGTKKYWQLGFNPTIHIPCRIERKKLYNFKKQKRESIISIKPCNPEPGKCITVEGGVYLTGKYLTPTHNSISITETLPSWYLGKHQDHTVIVAGYSGDFVQRFGRRNIDKIRTYGSKIFGDKYELADSPCNNEQFELSNHKGGARFAGILGGITGNPANLIIIDDPIKNRQEAYSESTREAIKNEYLYSVKTRLAAAAKLIVIATRWVEDDLIGWLEENELNTTVINIPCECIDPENDPLGRELGDALMPEIGKGRSWLKQFKESYLKTDGSTAWSALFQGRPVSANGNIWLRPWWRYYETPPNVDEGVIAISLDATFKEGTDNDFCVIQAWQKVNDNYYFLDTIRKRMGFVDTLDAVREMLRRYPDTQYIYVEDKANGSAIIDMLVREFTGVVPVSPEGGKHSRAAAVSHLIESGRVWLPKYASWVEDFLKEAGAFPAGKHDDQVDATSQALNRLSIINAEFIPPKKRRYVRYTDDMWEDLNNATPELELELLKLWGFPEEWRDDYE